MPILCRESFRLPIIALTAMMPVVTYYHVMQTCFKFKIRAKLGQFRGVVHLHVGTNFI